MKKILKWIAIKVEIKFLLSLLAIISMLFGLVELVDDVFEGDTENFDHWVLRLFRQENLHLPYGPSWALDSIRDVTSLGGVVNLSFFIFMALGLLLIHRRYHLLVFLLCSTVTGMATSFLLKNFFNRPRPSVVPHLAQVQTSSFPSGHAMMSAIVYLTLGTLMASVASRKRTKIYVLTMSLLLTFIVGASRIYLGVHYPTDVLAGWIIGILWALCSLLLARKLFIQKEPAAEPID